MNDLNAVVIFAAVVDAGSFTGAARRLELPKSTVSRKVSDLERELGARLLQRTTRTLALTDAGRAFYPHATRVAEEIDAARRAVVELHEVPRGRLRVTAPIGLAFLGPIVAAFVGRYPEVSLELSCTDRVVDLVDERFDVAIRAGALRDSSLVARRLVAWTGLLVAADRYLERRGAPAEPAELADHDCLAFTPSSGRARWTLSTGASTVDVEIEPLLGCTDLGIVEDATRAGLGVALLPAFRCADAVRDAQLSRVLPDWSEPAVPLSAVYPSRRHLSPAVAAFVDHLSASLAPPPWSDVAGRSGPA